VGWMRNWGLNGEEGKGSKAGPISIIQTCERPQNAALTSWPQSLVKSLE